MREELVPATTVLTATILDARQLLADAGTTVGSPTTIEEVESLAKAVQALGPKFVLIRQENFQSEKSTETSPVNTKQPVLNVLFGQGEAVLVKSPYQKVTGIPGAGYSLTCKFSQDIMKTGGSFIS